MDKLPLTRPSLGDEESELLREVIRSGWLAQGPRVIEFEEKVAEFCGGRWAAATTSCTTGLELVLKIAGVKPGEVVITVSHSFIATANSVRACNAEPVFVDIDVETLNLSPAKLEEALAKDFEEREGNYWYRDVDRLAVGESPLVFVKPPLGRLAAILVVHQVGMPAEMAAINGMATKCGVPVIEDAACALGSEISFDDGQSWERVGAPHSMAAVFSLHPRKVITTGEGGMIVFREQADCERAKRLRHHGMSLSDLERSRSGTLAQEEYVETAHNYRMCDLQAAVGIAQMGRLHEIVARRRELARVYRESLADVPGVAIQEESANVRTNWQSFVVRVPSHEAQVAVREALAVQEIASKPGIMCAHLEAPYTSQWDRGVLAASEQAFDCGITLPLFPEMDAERIKEIAGIIASALRT